MTTELVVVHLAGSALAGREQRLAKTTVKIGRRPENDVTFDAERDRSVSGYHAEVWIDGATVRIKDVGSNNGTFVNGARIAGPTALAATDVIRLGEAGPELRVATGSALAAAGPAPAAGGKKAIGEATLQRTVEGVAARERKKGVTVALALAGAVGVLALVGLSVHRALRSDVDEQKADVAAAKGQASEAKAGADQALAETAELKELVDELTTKLDERVAASLKGFDEELALLRDQVAAGEAKAARIIAEMGERDRALQDLRQRQDISDAARAAAARQAEARLAALQADLDKTQDELRKGGDAAWPALVDRYKHSMFLLVCQGHDGSIGIGTGWLARADGLVVTNSHVVDGWEKMRVCIAVQNLTGREFKVKRWKMHPEYKAPNSPDVALVDVELAGERLTPFVMANDSELQASLRVGMHLGTIGYPGEMLEEYVSIRDPKTGAFASAQATFKDGWVGRLTDFGLRSVPFAQAVFIQHSASTTRGCSGSPLFTADGKVVGLHNSGKYMQIVNAGEGGQLKSDIIKDTAMISRGIRVDLVRRFIASTGW